MQGKRFLYFKDMFGGCGYSAAVRDWNGFVETALFTGRAMGMQETRGAMVQIVAGFSRLNRIKRGCFAVTSGTGRCGRGVHEEVQRPHQQQREDVETKHDACDPNATCCR